MLRKILSLTLIAVLTFNIISVSSFSADAADSTMTTLVQLIKKFPHGKYWNHVGSKKNKPEGVTSKPCKSHKKCDYYGGCSCNSYNSAIQCMGYANLISEKITGVPVSEYTKSKKFDVKKLRVGDIVRQSGHSVCITGVSGDKIALTDCNYGARCIIRWTTVDRAWFTKVEYVLHLKGNSRTNKKVNFHDKYKNNKTTSHQGAEQEDIQGAEIWRMENGSDLNIRKSPAISSEIIGTVPAAARFKVYEKTVRGGYLWGRIEYDGTEGYCALNYADHISGAVEIPAFRNIKPAYTENSDFTLNWTSVSGADRYTVYLYNSQKKRIASYKSKDCAADIEGQPLGEYYVKVISSSTKASTWKIESELEKLSVSIKSVPVTKISLKKSFSLEAGDKYKLRPDLTPDNATDGALVWTSSDEDVARVDKNGTVTATGAGKAEIECRSRHNESISTVCIVSVKPSSVKTIQTKEGTGVSSIGLSWTQSKGADGYAVYKYIRKSDKYKKIVETKDTSYVDEGLKTAVEYRYLIKPFAKADGKRIYASCKSVSTVTAPGKVENLIQLGSDTGRLKLQWKNIPNADKFVIYTFDYEKNGYRKLSVTDENSIIIKDRPFTENTYCVVAAVKTGDGYVFGEASEDVTGITGIQAPEVSVKKGKTYFKAMWTETENATHYQVFRLKDGKKVLVKNLSADSLSYTQKGLEADRSYTYYIRAVHKTEYGQLAYSDYVPVKVRL